VVELATFVQVIVMIGAPIALVRALRARYGVGWLSFVIGAVGFVLSQVGHLPFNAMLMPLLPAHGMARLVSMSIFLGLSAGCFEEVARYLAMRFAMEKERTGAHALAYGAGHGGIESAILGGLVSLTLINILIIERNGIENLGLDAAQAETVRAQIAAFHQGGVLPCFLAAMERLCTIPFHVAASTLVMRAVVERRVMWLLVAIVFHAITDGLILPVTHYLGSNAVEAFVLASLPVSLMTIAISMRALPKLPRPSLEERPPAKGEPIELVRVEKRYGEVHALRGVSFTLREGERACLLGPNGAGKTTTIRLITGAVAPTRGFTFVLGKTSDDEGFLDEKRRVGIVPQQPGMYEHMSVRAYLDLVRDLYDAKDPDDGITERLGLSDVLDRSTSALSGGMQRRLALAAALLPRPDVLVLDEPSAGLDPVASRQMIECVRDASANRTTLLCTHNLAEAEELCESVIILRGGEVLVHTRIDELRAKVASRIALRANAGIAPLEAALTKLGHTTEIDDGEVRVTIANAEHAAPKLLRALLDEGIDVYECRIVKPSLEELFLQVIERGVATPSVPPVAPKEAS
jgi:ABC-2 type transport system ATP-binding protein